MIKSSKAIIGLSLIGTLVSGHLLVQSEKEKRKQDMDAVLIDPPAKDPTYQRVRNYDWDRKGYHMYSDEEIRMMREKQSYKSDGSYIYTPGRVVPSHEEIIENYLEDNPELIEEYMDKYRN